MPDIGKIQCKMRALMSDLCSQEARCRTETFPQTDDVYHVTQVQGVATAIHGATLSSLSVNRRRSLSLLDRVNVGAIKSNLDSGS